MSNGINPTPEFFANQHTGTFVELLPDTLLVKGAKNNRGFDQGYAIKHARRKEYILIDVVGLATKEAVQELMGNGNTIKAVVITGKRVLQDAYADLNSISEDTGGAAVYLPPTAMADTQAGVKSLSGGDSLLKEFDLDADQLPREAGAAVFCSKNGGMLFPGNSALGSPYNSNDETFTRERLGNKSMDFEFVEFWREYDREFRYLFPREGKPVIEIEAGTRRDILNRLSRGE